MSSATQRKEGWLVKQGGTVKSWKKRWFLLNRDIHPSNPEKPFYTLKYYKSNDKSELLGTINLVEIKLIQRGDEELKRPFALKIVTQPRIYFLLANTERELEGWTSSLIACMHEMTGTLHTVVDTTGSENLPKSNDDLFGEQSSSTPPPSAPTSSGRSANSLSSANSSSNSNLNSISLTGPSSNAQGLMAQLPPIDSAIIKLWLQKKKEGKNWKRRWCLLFPRKLAYFKNDAPGQEPQGIISLDKTQALLEDADKELKKQNSFKIVSGDKVFFFICESVHDKDMCMNAIRTILEDTAAFPTNKRLSVGNANVILDRSNIPNSQSVSVSNASSGAKVSAGIDNSASSSSVLVDNNQSNSSLGANNTNDSAGGNKNDSSNNNNNNEHTDNSNSINNKSDNNNNNNGNNGNNNNSAESANEAQQIKRSSFSSPMQMNFDSFGPLFIPKCSAEGGGVTQGYVGEPSIFTIFARDSNGNLRVGRSDPFVVKINGPYGSRHPEPKVKNNFDGTYTVSYMCEEEGDYVVAVTVDGQNIVDSPYYAPHDYRINRGTQGAPGTSPSSSSPFLVANVPSPGDSEQQQQQQQQQTASQQQQESVEKDFLNFMSK